MVRIRTPREEREAKKREKEDREDELADMRQKLDLAYVKVKAARDVAREKLDDYLAKVEGRAPDAEITSAKNDYEQEDKTVQKLVGERDILKRKALRKFSSKFKYLRR